MSRIGKIPVPVPDKVKVTVDAPTITVQGPKGQLSMTLPPMVAVTLEDAEVKVATASDNRKSRAMQGLTRSLIGNMVTGVTEGFTKSLEIQGVGYRAESDANSVTLHVGYSNPIKVSILDGLSVEVEKNTILHVRGTDKQKVGEMAARIRRVRKPEPYRGKGIRYLGETIRRKVGKAGAK